MVGVIFGKNNYQKEERKKGPRLSSSGGRIELNINNINTNVGVKQ